MAIRRIAVEEAFVTPEIMAQWHVVLAGRDVEPGFAKMGEFHPGADAREQAAG